METFNIKDKGLANELLNQGYQYYEVGNVICEMDGVGNLLANYVYANRMRICRKD